ncbi:coagulation factor XIII A chain-like [Thalassophryne amazonica]|uniref:coagulation factor XIII A chain-like n=1 Tax=Thalassophryne amazonica TaxID=390379 RepID=UPI00147141A8|nr:coagulation factor XIII A chain-like [Thalassophryne amazonica]
MVSSGLFVVSVDMNHQVNRQKHFTTHYSVENLVVRRGQQCLISITFNRRLVPTDNFHMEFLIGTDPSETKGSRVIVTFGNRPGGRWAGEILNMQTETVMLGIVPLADAIVGRYRFYVAIMTSLGIGYTKKDTATDIYVLCNAWCPEDVVYLQDEAERQEYVLNDYGVMFQGSVDNVYPSSWMYGQFERGILDACIFILDACQMPIFNRGNIITLVRKASAAINSLDDNGVLVGNWSDDFSMGTAPTQWTGSGKILLQYSSTGVPVCYGQCWVFAGVFNTFLRCFGIPARVITNFNSAHDSTGNLITELIFKEDGSPDRENTRDSIWNYHCWNEVFMQRRDLPTGMGGWQVVDATPQETSDGYYRCGPTSVAAIKEGLLYHPFDAGFVFAEVNSDVVFKKRDHYGHLITFRVNTTYVGKLICTKAVGSDNLNDITLTYKYPEGSPENDRTMARAESFDLQRDHSEIEDLKVVVTIQMEPAQFGEDITLNVDFHNQADTLHVLDGTLMVTGLLYTGISIEAVKEEKLNITMQPQQTVHETFHVRFQDYMDILRPQLSLSVTVAGRTEDQVICETKVLNLPPPRLELKLKAKMSVIKHKSYECKLSKLSHINSFMVYNCFIKVVCSHFRVQMAPSRTLTFPSGSVFGLSSDHLN